MLKNVCLNRDFGNCLFMQCKCYGQLFNVARGWIHAWSQEKRFELIVQGQYRYMLYCYSMYGVM